MSTSFEVMAAAQAGIKVLGLSLITNKCVAPGDTFPEPTHEEVLVATAAAAKGMLALVQRFVATLDVAAYPPSFSAAAFAHVAPNKAAGKAKGACCCSTGCATTDLALVAGGAAVVGGLVALAAARLLKLKL